MTANTLVEALSTTSTPDLSSGICVEGSEVFDAVDDPGMTDRAIALCHECPVLVACRAWADKLAPNDIHGVVAGRRYEWRKPSLLRKAPS